MSNWNQHEKASFFFLNVNFVFYESFQMDLALGIQVVYFCNKLQMGRSHADFPTLLPPVPPDNEIQGCLTCGEEIVVLFYIQMLDILHYAQQVCASMTALIISVPEIRISDSLKLDLRSTNHSTYIFHTFHIHPQTHWCSSNPSHTFLRVCLQLSTPLSTMGFSSE